MKRKMSMYVCLLIIFVVVAGSLFCSFIRNNQKQGNENSIVETDSLQEMVSDSKETDSNLVEKSIDGEKELTSEGTTNQSDLSMEDLYKSICSVPYDYFGYIFIEDNILHIDPVELIWSDNTERIAELEISEWDMPSGYYFYNPDNELLSFKITEETEYCFVSMSRAYPDEILVITDDVNAFLENLELYGDFAKQYGFCIVLDGDCVKYVIDKYPTLF